MITIVVRLRPLMHNDRVRVAVGFLFVLFVKTYLSVPQTNSQHVKTKSLTRDTESRGGKPSFYLQQEACERDVNSLMLRGGVSSTSPRIDITY